MAGMRGRFGGHVLFSQQLRAAERTMKKFFALMLPLLLGCSIAQAADLPQPPPPSVMRATFIPIAPPFSWTGFYGGGNIGWGWTNVSLTDAGPAPFGFGPVFPLGSTTSLTQNGFLAGAQIGANWQIHEFVLGAEADFDATTIRNSQGITGAGTGSYKDPWIATLAARFGWAANRTLFYGKAGGAFMDEKYSASASDGSSLSGSFSRWGWVVGAGVEYAVTDNVTLKAEYNYLDFGSTNQTLTPNATDVVNGTLTFDTNSSKLTANVVKLGVNVLLNY
jgi:outer membrane immunogenic protein